MCIRDSYYNRACCNRAYYSSSYYTGCYICYTGCNKGSVNS